MITKKQILSTDFCALIQIYEDTEIKKEPTYFTKLLKETGLPSMQLHKSLDRLYDKIMIDMQIVKTEDGKQTMGFTISENFLPFTEGLYKATEEVINERYRFGPFSKSFRNEADGIFFLNKFLYFCLTSKFLRNSERISDENIFLSFLM